MKKIKVVYWSTTLPLALLSIGSAYGYLTQAPMQEAFRHLGFPDYFRTELALAKILGAILLIIPLQGRFKEWVYAGFGITYISAFIAHCSLADPAIACVFPAIALVLLLTSYSTSQRLRIPSRVRAMSV